MIVQTIKVNDCAPQIIVIGRRGTYDTLQIAFDLSYLVESYGNGVAVLAVKRSQDESAYPAVTSQEDDLLLWTVSETDTYYVGAGEAQLMWYVDGGLAKTIIYPMVVMKDILMTSEEAPDAYQTWVDDLTALGAETLQNAQDAAQSASDAETAKDDAVAAKEAAEAALEEFTTPTASATSLAPSAEATASYSNGQFSFGIPRGEQGAKGDPGEKGDPGSQGEPGVDGFSPTITVADITGGHRVTITDKNGTRTVDVMDGTDGTDGTDGYSPVVTITNITGGHRVTITDEYHPQGQSFDVMDGSSDAGGVTYDPTQTYPSGSVGAELSNQKNAIDTLESDIDTKAPVIINTASGDIATFSDGADGMPIKHLVANIEAVQSGTGDPSPENIRPISGWTGLTGARVGKNLVDISQFATVYSDRCTYAEGVLSFTSLATAMYTTGIPTRVPSGATLSWQITTGTAENFRVRFGYADGTAQTILATTTSFVAPKEITSICIDYTTGGTATLSNFMASVEPSDYVPYQGQTISVSWATEAGTVYGGTLDVVTGVLTVDRNVVQIPTDYWSYNSNLALFWSRKNNNPVLTNLADPIVGGYDVVCSAYKHFNGTRYADIVNGEFSVGLYNYSSQEPYVLVKDTRFTTLDDFKANSGIENVSFEIPLATPQTYQLDPVAVNTLLGNNTVYVDCGSVTVDYPADTGIVVAQQSNAINQKQDATSYVTLSGTIVTQTGADNTMYLCGELAELTFTAPATGITAIRFTSGTTPTVVTLNGITMPDDWTGAEASTTYEINVLNGLGAWQSWT